MFPTIVLIANPLLIFLSFQWLNNIIQGTNYYCCKEGDNFNRVRGRGHGRGRYIDRRRRWEMAVDLIFSAIVLTPISFSWIKSALYEEVSVCCFPESFCVEKTLLLDGRLLFYGAGADAILVGSGFAGGGELLFFLPSALGVTAKTKWEGVL